MNLFVIFGSLLCLLISLYGVGAESLLESIEDGVDELKLAASK